MVHAYNSIRLWIVGVLFVSIVSVVGYYISHDSEVFLIDESTLQIETKYYSADKLFDELRDVAGFAVSSDLEIPKNRVTYSYDAIDIREFLFEFFGEQDIAFSYAISGDDSPSIVREVFTPVVDIHEIDDVFDVQFKHHESEVFGFSFDYFESYVNDGCPYNYVVESSIGSDNTLYSYELIKPALEYVPNYVEKCAYQDRVAPDTIIFQSFSSEDELRLELYPKDPVWYEQQGVFTLEGRSYYFLSSSEAGSLGIYWELDDVWYLAHINGWNDFSENFVDEEGVYYPFSFLMSVVESVE